LQSSTLMRRSALQRPNILHVTTSKSHALYSLAYSHQALSAGSRPALFAQHITMSNITTTIRELLGKELKPMHIHRRDCTRGGLSFRS
jgi:hypothetical protein